MAFDRARAQQELIRLAKAGTAKSGAGRLRGPIGRATRRFRGEFTGPLVTVVLPVSDDETTRIGTCLDSLKVQTYRNLEILVVRFGRHERVTETVRHHAAEDWRIKTRIKVENSLAAARSAGLDAARGELVIVVTQAGDDFVHAGIERLVDAHQRSGSPLVVGAMREPDIAAWVPESAYDAAHHSPHRATTLSRTPVAVTDLLLGNKLATAELWQRAGRFSDDVPDGSDVALSLLQHAEAFDVLTDETYIPTNRRDGIGVGTVVDHLSGLDAWRATSTRTRNLIAALGIPEAEEWWLWGVLDTSVQLLIGDVERADDQQWQTLRDQVAWLLDAADATVWARLTAEARVKLWLVQHDHREKLEEFLAERLFLRGNRPTVIRDGRVFALLPHHDDADLAIPAELFEMTADETRFRATLREVDWHDPENLRLTVFATIDFVHLAASPDLECALIGTAGQRIPLTIEQFRDFRANQFGRRYQDYSWGAVHVTVPVADVVAAASEASWTLEIAMTVDGVSRAGAVAFSDEQGTAGLLGRDHLAPRPVAGSLVSLAPRSDVVGLRVSVDDVPRVATVTVDGRTVTGTFAPSGDSTARIEGVRLSQGGQAEKATLADGTFRITLPTAWSGRAWQVRAVLADGHTVDVGWPADTTVQWLAVGQGELVASRTPHGGVEMIEASDLLVIDEIDCVGTELTARGRWLARTPRSGVRVELVGEARGAARIPATVTETSDGVELHVTLTDDRWGLGARPLPIGWYWFKVVTSGGSRPALWGERGADRIGHFIEAPEHPESTEYAVRLVQSARGAGVELLPPLPTEDRVPFGQTELWDWHQNAEVPLEKDSVYFQSYVGATATDSQLALHDELRRTRPELKIYWGITSSHSWVPDGAVPVVMTSREWYHVLSSVEFLCFNIDPERWFRKRPGQKLLQTFHGYPSKSMGLRMWEAKGYPQRRLDLELDRTRGQWDLILTPDPDMDQYYRREYAYDGPIHSKGYPRDDVLVDERAGTVREDTRRRLGIEPHQKAVLYAPTWRDDQATNWRAADAVHHLDIEAAARDLGPDYVLLLRGHRFHNAAADSGAAPRFLDVTAYPEINDLILASDAAVLDYSSLRFDFALTRRPMVFLVPDLDQYVGGVRGFLYDYGPTAPGPHVNTADEVVAHLKDIDGMTRRYADAQAAFHQRFSQFMDGHAAERVAAAFFGPSEPTA